MNKLFNHHSFSPFFCYNFFIYSVLSSSIIIITFALNAQQSSLTKHHKMAKGGLKMSSTTVDVCDVFVSPSLYTI